MKDHMDVSNHNQENVAPPVYFQSFTKAYFY